MSPVSLVWIATLVLTMLWWDQVGAQGDSLCQTMQYRALTPQLQNEHQCMILEQLQRDFNKDTNLVKGQYENIYRFLTKFQDNLYRSLQLMSSSPSRDSGKTIPNLRGVPLVRDCSELQQNGVTTSGVYPIRLPDRNIVNIWCDMETAHGGWTLIQKRGDGSENFARTWDDYSSGFGNPNTEYWIGNENIYRLTNNKEYSVRFDMWDWEGNTAHAQYDEFRIDSEQLYYQLKITGYSGTAGDAMSNYHDNMQFSTFDMDNDAWTLSCAKKDQSGWWFRACGYASPNGLYVQNGRAKMTPDGVIRGITWFNWKKDFMYSMKRMEIKIKPRASVLYDIEVDKLNARAAASVGSMRSGSARLTSELIENIERAKSFQATGAPSSTTTSTATPTSTTTTTPTTTTTTTPKTTTTTSTTEPPTSTTIQPDSTTYNYDLFEY